MSHVRNQVRDAVVNILDVQNAPWKEVFNTRIIPSRDIHKYLIVYISDESIVYESISECPSLRRSISLIVRADVRITSSYFIEDELDILSSRIEQLLTFNNLNPNLSNKLGSILLTESTFDISDETNDRSSGNIELTFDIEIFTEEGFPEKLI